MDDNDDDVDVDVEEYVASLRRQTEDTINLVQKLCSTTGKLKQVQRKISAEYVTSSLLRPRALLTSLYAARTSPRVLVLFAFVVYMNYMSLE